MNRNKIIISLLFINSIAYCKYESKIISEVIFWPAGKATAIDRGNALLLQYEKTANDEQLKKNLLALNSLLGSSNWYDFRHEFVSEAIAYAPSSEQKPPSDVDRTLFLLDIYAKAYDLYFKNHKSSLFQNLQPYGCTAIKCKAKKMSQLDRLLGIDKEVLHIKREKAKRPLISKPFGT